MRTPSARLWKPDNFRGGSREILLGPCRIDEQVTVRDKLLECLLLRSAEPGLQERLDSQDALPAPGGLARRVPDEQTFVVVFRDFPFVAIRADVQLPKRKQNHMALLGS